MDMKKYLFIAASALALASCSSEDFVGTEGGNVENGANKAINFSGNAGKITRATANTGTAAEMLDGQFRIYGVKKMSETQIVSVFNEYSVWDVANKTTSNTDGWEYVGANGTTGLGRGNISLTKNQTIKYWDYSAPEYHFVAGSPISNFKYTLVPGKDIESATIKGLAGHIKANETGQDLETHPVYIADPKVVKNTEYKNAVQFSFKRQQAMVRVGFYETIPGYSIHNVNFYDAEGTVSNGNNIILTSGTANYFVGGSNVEGTITYNWAGTTPSYTYAYSETGLTKNKNWYAGKLSTLATTSAGNKIDLKDGTKMELLWGTDKDMSTNGYFTVIPTPSATTAAPILIKCDYELISDDDSGETIKVTGATAAIPAAFSKWEANTRYTYLFKISDNTNGYTGNDPNKAGLYPITFDAVVKETTDAMHKEGTVTTVSTPSITTYQDGSVVENGGIKYVANKAIKVKVTDSANGTDLELRKEQETENTENPVYDVKVAVYKLSAPRTEADLQLTNITQAEFTTKSKQEITFGDDNKSFTFTPEGEGNYAIQYLTTAAVGTTPAAYTYKVVYVKAAPTVAP